MSIYDLTCIKNDVCDKAVCNYQHCKNRADTMEVMKHSAQQLKAEIAALADKLHFAYRRWLQFVNLFDL